MLALWLTLALLAQDGSQEDRFYQLDAGEGLVVVVQVSDDKSPRYGGNIVFSRDGMTIHEKPGEMKKAAAATWWNASEVTVERLSETESRVTNGCGTPVVVFSAEQEPGKTTSRIKGAITLQPGESGRILYGGALFVVTRDGRAGRLPVPTGLRPRYDNSEWRIPPWDEPFRPVELTAGVSLLYILNFKSDLTGTSFLSDGTQIDFTVSSYSIVAPGPFIEADFRMLQARFSFYWIQWSGGDANVTSTPPRGQGGPPTAGGAGARGRIWTLQLDLTRDWVEYVNESVHFELKAGVKLGYDQESIDRVTFNGSNIIVDDTESRGYIGFIVRPKFTVNLSSQSAIEFALDAFVVNRGIVGAEAELGYTFRF